jgi:hypothetical protein
MDEEKEVVEATNSTEDTTVEDVVDQESDTPAEEAEDVDALKEELAQALEAKKQLTARAKKAEAENRKLTEVKVEAKPDKDININNKDILSRQEAELLILKSQGLVDPELISELKALAAVRGKSLIEAQDDPIFKQFKESKEKEKKAEEARLGASNKGHARGRSKKDLNTPGLTSKEHKDLWLEKRE